MTLLQSLLNELKSAVDRAAVVRIGTAPPLTYVTTARLKSMIRKYEIQVPGDTSDQPGNYQIRGGNVEAKQHEGDRHGAANLKAWIRNQGGTAEWYTLDGESSDFLLKLDSPREPNIIGPGWWVVKTADGIFFAVSDSDFHIIYIPRVE